MPLPPKCDARRPLHLSALLMRLIGAFTTALAVLHVAAAVLLLPTARVTWMNILVEGLPPLIYGLVGLTYILLASALLRRRWWAVVASLILASITLAIIGAILILLI